MIPLAYINEWRDRAPWATQAMVEQDMLLCRILIVLFGDPTLKDSLIFRGGTALHKLCFPVPLRYSEDIDLVQRNPGPIGPVFDTVRRVLGDWLGTKPARKQGPGVVNLVYRLDSEDVPPTPLRFQRYMEAEGRRIFRADFSQNLAAKLAHPGFAADCEPLLRPGTPFDLHADARLVERELLALLPDL
jgi:hypothetical protein